MSQFPAQAYQSVRIGECVAPASWQTVDFVSDLHLQAAEPATLEAWLHYLESSPADALFILGDLFEVWIGDDAATQPGFEQSQAQCLRRAADRRPLFFVHGNRDFLVGESFAQSAGLKVLPDPTCLDFGDQRWLLSHGDLLCLDDVDYLTFRAQVRAPLWQENFLAKPLEERRAVARHIRMQSESRKADPQARWADVDSPAAVQWLKQANASTLIHGHTHRPAVHTLGDGLRRIVLSDWDATAQPSRLEVLRLTVDSHLERYNLR